VLLLLPLLLLPLLLLLLLVLQITTFPIAAARAVVLFPVHQAALRAQALLGPLVGRSVLPAGPRQAHQQPVRANNAAVRDAARCVRVDEERHVEATADFGA
jgi:hypothetical protein